MFRKLYLVPQTLDWSKYSEMLPNMVSHVIITYFSIGIAHAQPFRDQLKKEFCVLAVGPANSSVGRASDCSSEGRRFEPGLVDIETSLTQLVECQPHELKVVGSIPTRGTSCFNSIFVSMLTVVVP